MGLPIRITHLITSLDVGGAERMLLELVSRLDRAVVDQQVVCLMQIWPIGSPMQARARQADHVRLGYRSRAWKLIPNGVDTRRLNPDPEVRAAFRPAPGPRPEVSASSIRRCIG